MSYKILAIMSLGLSFLTACTSQPIPSAQWTCRNVATEISCQGGECSLALEGEFTPMELTLDSDGAMSLCAYSGCWAGEAQKIATAGNYFTAIGLNLPWSGTTGGPADLSATINMKTMVATVLTDNYAHPMTCVPL